MLTFKFAILLVSVQLNLAMIRSQIDIHRWSTHHTCENNDDCNRRLKTFWTPYEFVCCTTVLCDESYGDYYLVHSGCSTKRHCKPMIQIKDYTRFAGTVKLKFISAVFLLIPRKTLIRNSMILLSDCAKPRS